MPRRKAQAAKNDARKRDNRRIRILQPLAAQVRRLRLEQDLSQDTVAERAGFTPQHLGLIERAQVEPGALTLISLARALGVTVGKLFETTMSGQASVNELPPLPRQRATRRPKPY